MTPARTRHNHQANFHPLPNAWCRSCKVSATRGQLGRSGPAGKAAARSCRSGTKFQQGTGHKTAMPTGSQSASLVGTSDTWQCQGCQRSFLGDMVSTTTGSGRDTCRHRKRCTGWIHRRQSRLPPCPGDMGTATEPSRPMSVEGTPSPRLLPLQGQPRPRSRSESAWSPSAGEAAYRPAQTRRLVRCTQAGHRKTSGSSSTTLP
mmetsp:Transcript_9314/g.25274  ORF Transcript_9314/g.25274 Transcript_9314/m.25274 type:complete len:204 (+) Transcript_9314:1721-2332(+)